MNQIHLTGCSPVPLASYLKALGVFRIIAEQADAEAKAYWKGEDFALTTNCDKRKLNEFFLHQYNPTPVIFPWNGRAGFLEGEEGEESTRTGAKLLKEYQQSMAERLKNYRRLISILSDTDSIRELNYTRTLIKQLQIEKKEKEKRQNWTEKDQERLKQIEKRGKFFKDRLYTSLRNELPDDLLLLIDATVAIGTQKAFAPLLGGSGGVEGSMDLGVNFMANIASLFDFQSKEGSPYPSSIAWLNQALYREIAIINTSNAAGSLSPGQIGGPNSTTGFSEELSINPWDYVFMIEGALIFRPALTRRLQSSANASLSYPFAVEPTTAGAGNLAPSVKEKTRSRSSELWMPLWSRPYNLKEISALLSEGRVNLGKKFPRNGLDFACSISQLGVDRGIESFQRYIFLTRSGKSDLAVPISRHKVQRNFSGNLISDLSKNGFLEQIRKVSNNESINRSLKQALGNLENSLFDLTRPGSGRQALQRTITRIGGVMRILAASRKSRSSIAVMPDLSAGWLERADDGSHEFRIAAALCSLGPFPLTAVHFLFPVKYEGRRLLWEPESRSAVWGTGTMLERNLAAMAWRRIIDAEHAELKDKPFSGHLGATMKDIEALISGRTNNRKIEALMHGMVWAKLPKKLSAPGEISGAGAVPAAYNILKPFFTSDSALKRVQIIAEDNSLPFPREAISLLKAGNIDRALEIAWRRLRTAGAKIPSYPLAPPAGPAIEGSKLLAALLIPISLNDLTTLLPEKI